ncbi:RNA polymerase sigma factor [Paenibacillus sp. J5C_2022]|nr:RNA polymerase sigma factor [Paenibacillus sp. J5C2022]
MKKAQKGHEKAFLNIFRQYEKDIYRMAYVYVKNKEDALDVVQEVAYQSFKQIHTLQKPEYVKTWLMRIAINCAINTHNKNKKVVPLKDRQEDLLVSEEKDITLSISLQHMMNVLQDEEKSIVVLRFYESYTFKEIADLLNIPLGTAKSILYRALAKLRNELKEDKRYEI